MSNKYPPIEAIRRWLAVATPEMRALLVQLAHSSDCMFRQWIAGRRSMSADKAGHIANASIEIKSRFPDAPEPMSRGELCEACRNCEYFNGKKP